MKKPTCILLLGGNKFLNKLAKKYATKLFNVLAIVNTHESVLDEKKLAALKPDFVFNFLGDKILRGPLLKFKAINFHPAPPELRGRGSASLALYSDLKTHGATVHIITRAVDNGPILRVKRFKIAKNESCESLFEKAERACLELFYDMLPYISKTGKLPLPSGDKWSGKAMTRIQFEKWLVANPKNKSDFLKKIKAASHSRFRGPYVILQGYKFELIKE